MSKSALTRSLLVGSGLVCLACAGVGFAPPEWRGGWSLVRWQSAIAGVGAASALVFTMSLIAEHRRRSSALQGAWNDLQFQVDGLSGDQWEAACLAAMAPTAIDCIESERTFDAPLLEYRPAAPAPAPVRVEPAQELALADDVGGLASEPAAAVDLDALRAEIAVLRERLVRSEAETVRLRTELEELPALRERAAHAMEVDAALLSRLASLERDAAGSATRAQSAEEALRHVEDARREAQRQHAAEVARLEAEIARIGAESDAEHCTLHRRAADAEEAVRTALRELGVDPSDWPLTAAGVVRAVSPLTLHALGEGTPGWRAEAPEDTLAAAVLDLARSHRPRTAPVAALEARRRSA